MPTRAKQAVRKKRRNARRQHPRRPNALIYHIACILGRGWFRVANGFVYDRSAIRHIKKPVLVICNHQSNIDFLMAAATAYPLRLNFMVTTWFFNSASLRWLLNLMGCIPKKQFVPDTGAIKSVMKVIARGDSVAIFPEGQVCYAGIQCPIDESIGKLIKKLGVTTINLAIRGNHLTCPKWAKNQGTYRGRVECTASVLFTPEDIQALSVDEITARAVDALSYNEYEWQRQHMIPYKPHARRADGLNIILHRCPACSSELAMESAGSELRCEQCGYTVRLNRYGFLEPVKGDLIYDSPADWYAEELEALQQDFAAGRALPLVSPCRLWKTETGKHGLHLRGEGVMTLNEHGIFFEGVKDGEPLRLSTLYEQQAALTHSATHCAVDIKEETCYYGLEPLENRQLMRYVELYRMARQSAFDARS